MSSVFFRSNGYFHSVSIFSKLFDGCLSAINPFNALNIVHGKLIKVGFRSNTFLGNRCIDAYISVGSTADAFKAFHDMPHKNVFSWNLYLKLMVKCFDIEVARSLFEEMPERDVVSWNTIISGYMLSDLRDKALEMFFKMRSNRIISSEFTLTLLFSCVDCANCAKEMHGNMMRNGVCIYNVVVGNSLIDMYGKFGLVDYARSLFFIMERVDVISWNSIISVYCKSGFEDYALYIFCSMGVMGYRPDEYTLSAVLAACSNLRNMVKGSQVFCLSMKSGLLWNTIVSSAAVDMFSKCNMLEGATRVFTESRVLDLALCNSMIAGCGMNGLKEKAVQLFKISLRENIRPNEFTLSSVLSSAANFFPMLLGIQLHSVVIKSGFELDAVVATSLVEVYSKHGLIDFALCIFLNMCNKDLVVWNTMIFGLTYNGKVNESILIFEMLVKSGFCPDHITFSAVLLACCYGGFFEKGMAIFFSMEMKYGVKPNNDHYVYVVNMMSRAGKIKEAIEFLDTMGCEPSATLWEFIILACKDYGSLNLIEAVADRILDLNPQASLPFLIMAHVYEKSGRWESVVRVRKELKNLQNKVVGCSWICIKHQVLSFEANLMIHPGGEAIYLCLESLSHEILYENDIFHVVGDYSLENGYTI